MSYPQPRYLGEGGEISATYRSKDHEPEFTYPSGNTVHYLATGATTNGQFGLYRWVMGPQRSGPDPHFHRSISESFFVLSGTVQLYDGGKWYDATAGDFLHVPVGGVHAFRNASGERADMLLLFAPGAPRETYFAGNIERAAAGLELTEEERLAFLRAHDQFDA